MTEHLAIYIIIRRLIKWNGLKPGVSRPFLWKKTAILSYPSVERDPQIRGRGRRRRKDFSRIVKKWTLRKASLHSFFTRKVNTVIFLEGGLALFLAKWENFHHLITCLHHCILAKPRSKVTTAIAFSRQNEAGSRARTSKYLRKSGSRICPCLRS